MEKDIDEFFALIRSFFLQKVSQCKRVGVLRYLHGRYIRVEERVSLWLACMRRRLIDRFCHRFLLSTYRMISLTR